MLMLKMLEGEPVVLRDRDTGRLLGTVHWRKGSGGRRMVLAFDATDGLEINRPQLDRARHPQAVMTCPEQDR